jgi:DNA-binding IclR family transcriptional regulator
MLPRLFFEQPQRIWTQGDLAVAAGMTKAYVSIILHRMMDNEYIRQEDNGYQLVNPEKMLDDWVAV